MSEVGFILLSALFLAVPLAIKYMLAFQARHLLVALKRREREVDQLAGLLEGMERECLVLGRAARQVEGQRRQAEMRRELLAEKLERLRRAPAEMSPIAV